MNKDLKALARTITLWNESRLDLFGISQPDKNLEFHGIIRFYHQDISNDGKYATKCVRVSSTAATPDVIDTLAEKFRSDMRMLTKPNYGLYEVHVNGESRKLKDSENPLLVQLNWIKDDREGRFLLKNEDDKRPVHVGNGLYGENEDTVKGFKLTRNLTKKEKKQKKKKEKQKKEESGPINEPSEEDSAAKQLYNEVPESTFTRTVSNPEAVMKKRREQKMQKRGAEVLKIYGDSINREIPYKTLLLLPNDKTNVVIRDTLDKYGLGNESAADYMIVQVVLPPGSKPEECFEGGWGKETVLGSEDCPLDIEQKWQPHQGTLVFQLRRRSSSYQHVAKSKPQTTDDLFDGKSSKKEQEKARKKPHDSANLDKKSDSEREPGSNKGPKLIELFNSGNDCQTHYIAPNVTEIGSDRRKASYGPFIELRERPGLMPSHCVITNMDGVVTVTPHDGVGEVYVDGKIIEETTMLAHRDVVRLGRNKQLIFCDPGKDISMTEIQRKLRSNDQRSNKNQRSQQPAQSNYSAMRQRDGSSGDLVGDRPRHRSATSSTSSKSASLPHNTLPPQDRQHMRDIPENRSYERPRQQRNSQSQRNDQQPAYHRSGMPPQTATVQPIQQPTAPKLPARLRVPRDAEEALTTEILSVQANSLHFKLSPAYTIYLMQRCLVEERRNAIISHLMLVTDLLEQTIQLNSASVSELSFWMANTSELLNFVRQDNALTNISMEIQDIFAKTVQLSFRHLVQCMQRTLFTLMPAFLSESDEDLPGGNDTIDLKRQKQNTNDPTMYEILNMLSSAMSLLRRCRVNAALTIQLFSQLFHSINMWLFNKLVSSADSKRLCCREWGMRIRARLAMVETWAEKQGLELAADCHLARITQATHLLQAPKQTRDDVAAISGTCFKLNSLQLRALLSNYQPCEEDGETRISRDLIDEVVAVAENSADELTRSDGRDVRLQEDPDLQLPFLLPEDGYSCDVVRGVPSGLTEFVEMFVQDGLCTYHIEPTSSGSWTIHFQSLMPDYQNLTGHQHPASEHSHLPPQPEIVTIAINKRGGGMGLSIVAARGLGQDKLGIYIRSVVDNGASHMDGRLQAGDQLLSVDGQSLVGVDQAKAAELMTKTGQTVTLQVAKQGAVYHGLATLLNQPSPKQSQSNRRMNAQHPASRPKSEGYALYQNAREPHNRSSNYAPHSTSYSQNQSLITQEKQATSLNQSTPHLNENYDRNPQSMSSNAPRSAMSMGNLQQTAPDPDVSSPRSWRNNKQESSYRTEPSNIANTRRKATSQTTLTSIPASEPYKRQDIVDKRSAPYQADQAVSTPSYTKSPQEDLPSPPSQHFLYESKPTEKYPQNALDNPNYDHLPPPPPELTYDQNDGVNRRHFRPVKSDTPPLKSESGNIPSKESRIEQSPNFTKEKESAFPNKSTSQTLGRPGSGKRPEVARVTPTQKKKHNSDTASKSSTLPRHFKSASPWERDEREKKEQSIQEQLNALRDEEIDELSERSDLTPLEEDRLKNLLQERDFQARVQEEKMRMFSDEDGSEEDYSVPDRPDRDRLIRLEGAHAQRDAAVRDVQSSNNNDKENQDRLRWEEEQRRKKEEAEMRAKQEAERREERRRERERAERERQEERRKREEQRREAQRREEEQERFEREKEREELSRMNEYTSLQREEQEQRRRLEEIRRMREEEEEQLRQLQAKREAEERSLQYNTESRRLKERLSKQKEAEAREDAEREYLEQKLSAGKPGNYGSSHRRHQSSSSYGPTSYSADSGNQQKKPSFYKTSYTPSSSTNRAPTGSVSTSSSRPVMRGNSKSTSARPVSDGYMLGKNDWSSEDTLPPQPSPSTPPSNSSGKRPISYVATARTPGVIGSQEVYNDPRNKREATMKRDQSFKRRGPDPSRLTFKDRQRLFQGGDGSPMERPKSSKKLLQLEENLRDQM